MSSLTELPPSLPSALSVEVMSQPVTTPNSSELASQLEELSGLASQIFRFSDELRAVLQSDPPANGASVCAPLSLALSNARSCLSLMQLISQTPVPPPTPLPFIPPALSLTSTTTIAEATLPAFPAPPFPTHPDVEMKVEEAAANALLTLAAPRLTIDTTHPPAVPLVPPSPFAHTLPPTRRWPLSPVPLPPIRTTPEHPTQTPGGRLDSGYSPSSPLFSHRTSARQSVPLAELVDEEGSSPGTRGGMRSFPSPAATRVNMSLPQSPPPLFISIVDVTPSSTMKAISGAPEVPEVRSLRSSPFPPPEMPGFFTTPAPVPSQSPSAFPTRNDHSRGCGEDTNAPRRYKRKGPPLVDPEVPDRRVTRSSSAKGRTTEDFGTRAAPPPKRARTGSP